ncbi:hypothetical protein CBNV_gp119 [Clanis bilineata nucleopolyhedrovirus]|uniref:Uncharacterized protein n=1 Tax=Clanis bilineata nucleopolyhedrovirus TaxID=1307957 RepID=Q0N3Y3_9ABAC|nr:hypothetical protein CBNV_gp119 [Clanis bilineata nucleopolyhedrovirus]ABF47460.1 hypothetical protein [Clanis bilineata nucleopolyhedrovirus]
MNNNLAIQLATEHVQANMCRKAIQCYLMAIEYVKNFNTTALDCVVDQCKLAINDLRLYIQEKQLGLTKLFMINQHQCYKQ